MKNKHLAKSIFTLILLVIFIAAPLTAQAKSDKSNGNGKPQIAAKEQVKEQKQEQKIEKKEQKKIEKEAKWSNVIDLNLDMIQSSLTTIKGRIDKYTGATQPGTPAPTQSPAPTATPDPTQSPSPTETPAPSASPAPSESPVPTATPAPTVSPAPAGQEDVDESDEHQDGHPSLTGFVNGNKGKLHALSNKLNVIKKFVTKLPSDGYTAVSDRIKALETEIAAQVQRLNQLLAARAGQVTPSPSPSPSPTPSSTPVPSETPSPSPSPSPSATPAPSQTP